MKRGNKGRRGGNEALRRISEGDGYKGQGLGLARVRVRVVFLVVVVVRVCVR